VHEAVDLVGELDEGAEVRDLGDLAVDEVADAELAVDLAPRVGLGLLDAQGDALLVDVDVEHDGFHVVALLHDLGRVVDAARPAHVGHVHHAVDAVLELDEGAVVREVADLAADAGADRVVVADLLPRIGLELADAEGDLLLLLVDVEDDGVDFLADLEDVGRLLDALGPGELGDVDEAFDAALDLDERAVGDEVDDLAMDLLAHGVALLDAFPRVGLGLLEAEGDALALTVDFDDHDGDLLADLDDLARVADAAPGHVGDVQQAVETVEVHERAVVGDVLDDAAADDARLDLLEELATALAALFLDELATRDDEVLLLLVDLDDLEVEGLADEALEVLRGVDVDLRGRHEGVDADGDDQAALDDGLDATLDDGAFLAVGLDALPLADLLGAVEGDGRGAVLVLKLLEVDLELHADLDFGHVGKFGLGDEALGLAVDVDDDELVVADLGDGRRDDGVGLERAEIGLGEQFFHDAHCVFDCGSWASRRTFPGFWLLVGFPSGDSTGRRRWAGERSKTNDPRGAGKPRLLSGDFFRRWPGRGRPGRPLFQLSA